MSCMYDWCLAARHSSIVQMIRHCQAPYPSIGLESRPYDSQRTLEVYATCLACMTGTAQTRKLVVQLNSLFEVISAASFPHI